VSKAGSSPSRVTCFLVVAATLWTTTPAGAQSVAEFYAGKQISFIVGASPGGGYDTQARLVARHMGKHIAGNPTIILQNMPAAGSLAAIRIERQPV
jgi:tripartite-type tricarboxylate transporter receptor subunit TctC